MLWRTRGWLGPPPSEPHEDTPLRRTIRHRLKGQEWTREVAPDLDLDSSTAVNNNNNYNNNNNNEETDNYTPSSHLKWRCPTTATTSSIILVNYNDNNNTSISDSRLHAASVSRNRSDGNASSGTRLDVHNLPKSITARQNHHASGSGTRDVKRKFSAVSSTSTKATERLTVWPTIAEVSSRVGILPEAADWISTQSLAVVKKTLSTIARGSLSKHWFCHKRHKTNENNSLADVEYVDKPQRGDKLTNSSATLTPIRQWSGAASPRSVCSSSGQQYKYRSRLGHGLAHRFKSLNVIVTSLLLLLVFLAGPANCGHSVNCEQLLIGQYRCSEPEIDVITQQVLGCSSNNSAPVVCSLAPELFCLEGTGINETHFMSEVPCEWTNGYSFELSLLLSVFLGWLGLDRLYLGYPGLALAKFCTLGGIFLWQLIDIVLIAMQVVRPADGSQYVVSYFGPRLTRLSRNNDTQILAQDDW